MRGFWQFSRYSRELTHHLADDALRSLETADLETLRDVLVQYRWFTAFYPGDLGILVSKLPPCSLRSFVGTLVHEELGSGKPAEAHLALYDSFLAGLGVTASNYVELTNPACLALMDSMRLKLLQNPYAFGIGLRAMGGECLCQVYLKALHEYLAKNPIIRSMRSEGKLDWRFWDLHAGEEDEEHARSTRDFVQELVLDGSRDLEALCEGYLEAESKWKLFWINAFETRSLGRRAGFGRRLDEANTASVIAAELRMYAPPPGDPGDRVDDRGART